MLTRTEIAKNFSSFTATWKADLPNVIELLDSSETEFEESYASIISMNAWRNDILDGAVSEQSLSFFAEALNDALMSHILARFGSWRPALKALRSCIENTCYCLYYKDHPIELRLWELGKHRLGFTEMHSYLESHPDVAPVADPAITGLNVMKEEYGTLSRAVHASAASFRMSPNVHEVRFWNPDKAKLGQWRTRERRTLGSVNLLLITMFRSLLTGTQRPNLRKALSLAVPPSLHSKVKAKLNVTIFKV